MAESKSVVRTESAPAPFQGAPYSQAIRAGGFVFASGQLGLKPGDETIGGGIVIEPCIGPEPVPPLPGGGSGGPEPVPPLPGGGCGGPAAWYGAP